MQISNRLAKLEFDMGRNAYRVRPNLVATWGEDALMSPDFYRGFVRDHGHTALPVLLDDGENVIALALKSNAPNSPIYVELDDWEEPIRVTHGELAAIRLFDEALSEEESPGEMLQRVVTTLVDVTDPRNVALRVAMFRRAQHHVKMSQKHGSKRFPPNLYWLLPWHWFEIHLDRLCELLATKTRPGKQHVDRELPDLGSYFHSVRAGLAPSLRQLTEWRSDNEPIQSENVQSFIDELWHTDLRRLPPTTRFNLARPLEFCAKFLERLRDRGEPEHLTQTPIAIAHAYLLAFSQLEFHLRPQMPEHLRRLSHVRDLPARQIASLRHLAEAELDCIATVTGRVLKIYEIESPAKPVKITELVKTVLKSHQSHLQSKAIQIEKQFESEEIVPANLEHLKNAFSNLVIDVVDVAARGEKVRVHVGHSHDWKMSGREGVRVTLTTGERIPKEKLTKLWEPFFTTKAQAHTGVGLWVTMNLVRRHGGSLRIRSSTRRGQSGTSFSIFLPTPEEEFSRTP